MEVSFLLIQIRLYLQGRRATEKMKHHQEKILFPAKKNNFFRTSARPIHFVNAYSHSSEGKHFPRIPAKDGSMNMDNNSCPRVLVMGDSDDGPGKKLLAVGDHVVANVLRDCGEHSIVCIRKERLC